MDFAPTEEQQLLKATARRFLEKECPSTLVRELNATPEGYSPALWRTMVEMGWLGLPFPEEYDGTEGSFLDLAMILEEMGRALLPGPFFSTVLLGGYTVLATGSSAQKSAILPRIAAGQLIVTLAALETRAAYDPADIALTAKPAGDHFILDGVKLFVPNAHIADLILTVIRTPLENGDHGLSILLVDGRDLRVRRTALKTIDDAKLFEVCFDGVTVRREDVLGEPGSAWPIIEKTLSRAAVAECLQLIGGAQVALDLSVNHVKNRIQFGQPIGSFQAVQHHLANMAMDLDCARFLAYQAAWMISEDLPCEKEVAMAKAWVSDACSRIVSLANQVHGGASFIAEHDLTLFFKRTTAGETNYGGSRFHYRALAQALEL